MDNCIITCHIGAGSYEAQEKIAISLANQIIGIFEQINEKHNKINKKLFVIEIIAKDFLCVRKAKSNEKFFIS